MMQYRVVTINKRGSWRKLWRAEQVRFWCAYELTDDGTIGVACFTPFTPKQNKEVE